MGYLHIGLVGTQHSDVLTKAKYLCDALVLGRTPFTRLTCTLLEFGSGGWTLLQLFYSSLFSIEINRSDTESTLESFFLPLLYQSICNYSGQKWQHSQWTQNAKIRKKKSTVDVVYARFADGPLLDKMCWFDFIVRFILIVDGVDKNTFIYEYIEFVEDSTNYTCMTHLLTYCTASVCQQYRKYIYKFNTLSKSKFGVIFFVIFSFPYLKKTKQKELLLTRPSGFSFYLVLFFFEYKKIYRIQMGKTKPILALENCMCLSLLFFPTILLLKRNRCMKCEHSNNIDGISCVWASEKWRTRLRECWHEAVWEREQDSEESFHDNIDM